jgi:coenzyme F420-0:L-glutamate ligase/coenzyme F420-1:gamma-L-glutamate ligase
VAIGSAGLPVLDDLRGRTDIFGRELQTSITGHADEIASAASLVMGQSDEGTPVVVVRGLKWRGSIDAKAADLLRRPSILTPELVRMV